MHCLPLAQSFADIFTALATVGLLITGIFALGFAKIQITDAKKLAQVQHLQDLWAQFNSEPMAKFRAKAAKAKLAANLSKNRDLLEVLNFFELLGLLTEKKFLLAEDVWEMFSTWILSYYEGSSTDRMPHDDSFDPNGYKNLEKLVRRLQDFEQKRNPLYRVMSESDLKKFWESEALVRQV